MKSNKTYLKSVWLIASFSVILFAGCNDDYGVHNNNDNNSNTDYPTTADVIYNAVTDIDGNSYNAVRIGDQIWMASNLRTTHYANGEEIPNYETPNSNVAVYGRLYSWNAAMHGEAVSATNYNEYFDSIYPRVQGVCPYGWHIPKRAEFNQLSDYCGYHSEYLCNNSNYYIAKALASNNYWTSVSPEECYGGSCAPGVDQSTNNATGFSAIPAYNIGRNAKYWTSSLIVRAHQFDDEYWEEPDCSYFNINYNDAEGYLSQTSYPEEYTCSIRCVKD